MLFDKTIYKFYNNNQESLASGSAELSSEYLEYVEKAGCITCKLAFLLLTDNGNYQHCEHYH